MGSKNSPGKFDCFSRAEPDEPMFVLLGRDATASLVVTFWRAVRAQLGDDGLESEKSLEAQQCALAMEKWAREHGKDVDAAMAAYEGVLTRSLSTRAAQMIRGLVRHAELREEDEPGGKIWDDESRQALDLARELGWGKGGTGRLP
jgi:hypothetical protein